MDNGVFTTQSGIMDQRPKVEDVENHVATAMEDGCAVALGGCQRAEKIDAG